MNNSATKPVKIGNSLFFYQNQGKMNKTRENRQFSLFLSKPSKMNETRENKSLLRLLNIYIYNKANIRQQTTSDGK